MIKVVAAQRLSTFLHLRGDVMPGRPFGPFAMPFTPATTAQAPEGDPPFNDGTWSDHPLWRSLRKARLRMAQGGRVRADFPDEVRALSGERLSISGFIKPAGFVAWAEGMGEFREFVLSRYSPDCPYCPAAGPTETIRVLFRDPEAPIETMASLEGILEVQDRMERGAFYRLLDAIVCT